MAAQILASGIVLLVIGFILERMFPKLRLFALPPDGGSALRKPALWKEGSKLFLGGSAIFLEYEFSKRLLLDQPQIGSLVDLLQVVSVPFFLVMGAVISWLHRGRESGAST